MLQGNQVNQNVEFTKVYKNLNLNMICVSYKFDNKTINGNSLAPKIKEYYENNSRGLVKIMLTTFVATIPNKYGGINLEKAVQMGMSQVAAKYGQDKFDFYIHFCNPKISHTGNKSSVTFASYTNCIHETGHLFDFGHANVLQYDNKGNVTVRRVHDPFDCMVVTKVYQSLNPVHRHTHGWYYPGEAVYAKIGDTYNLFQLKNFPDKTNIKTLFYVMPISDTASRRYYWITYGTFNGNPVVVFHTSDPTIKYTYLDAFYGTNKSVINHNRSGLSVNIVNSDPSKITIKLSAINPINTLTDNSNMIDQVSDVYNDNGDTSGNIMDETDSNYCYCNESTCTDSDTF
jgi:hypothetical protein